MTAICIIPARGGSRRIPRKNVREFMGKPMIAYPILTAIESNVFDRIAVSSDDAEILEIARAYGAEALERPKSLAEDQIGTQQVMQYALQHQFQSLSFFDMACCVYPCTPLLCPTDLQAGAKLLDKTYGANYAASVGYPPLQDAGCFYFGWVEAFILDRPLFDSQTVLYKLPPYRVCGITTEAGWNEALEKYKSLEGRI